MGRQSQAATIPQGWLQSYWMYPYQQRLKPKLIHLVQLKHFWIHEQTLSKPITETVIQNPMPIHSERIRSYQKMGVEKAYHKMGVERPIRTGLIAQWRRSGRTLIMGQRKGHNDWCGQQIRSGDEGLDLEVGGVISGIRRWWDDKHMGKDMQRCTGVPLTA